MAVACAPLSVLAATASARARVLVALLSTHPDEDKGTRADVADGVPGQAAGDERPLGGASASHWVAREVTPLVAHLHEQGMLGAFYHCC